MKIKIKKTVGRPKGEHNKILLGIRYDEDIVLWLRAKKFFGKFANSVLRREMNRELKRVDNEKEK